MHFIRKIQRRIYSLIASKGQSHPYQSQEDAEIIDFIWWIQASKLGGMPRPEEHELSALWKHGVRSIVSLLEDTSLQSKYENYGFNSLSLPIPDDAPPTVEQVKDCMDFVIKSKQNNYPILIHCLAGWGRTGTMLASLLILEGATAQGSIDTVQKLQPQAIRTQQQLDFLYTLEQVSVQKI